MYDQSDIKLFLSVVDEGSFSAAARKLGQTPSAVGKRIRALEDRLGVDLLVRSTRRMTLTDAGQRYAEDVREVIDRLTGIEEDLRDGARTLRGQIRLTAPMAYGQRFVAPAVADFMGSNPEVEVILSLTDKVVDLVGDGVDMAIRTGTQPDSSLISRRIGPYHRKICASPRYLAAAGYPASVADLGRHRCLKLPSEFAASHWNLEDVRVAGTRLGGGLICNSLDVLAAACIAGQGIACLPDFITQEALQNRQLVELLSGVQRQESGPDIVLLRPTNRQTSRRLRVLADHLFRVLRRSVDLSHAEM